MEEFLLIFRRDFSRDGEQPSPDEMQNHIRHWQSWYQDLKTKNLLSRPPQWWDRAGKVVRSDKEVINGPYVEIKESIGGMIYLKAADYEEAVAVAQNCPILEAGGNVEIRKAVGRIDE